MSATVKVRTPSKGARPPRRGASLLLSLTLFGLVATGCDSGFEGAGSYTVIVEWTGEAAPVGAALVYLTGAGIGEVSALDEARIWSNVAEGETGTRVVIVHPGTPSSLRFTVQVNDQANGAPRASLLNLATQANVPVLPDDGGHRVRVVRNP